MDKKQYIERVSELIAVWIAKIRLNTALDFYDINKVAEDLACKLLNLVFDLNLYNLNNDIPNHPAIDLGDKENRVAFQITSRTDAQKFKENIDAFEKDFYKTYSNGIRFLILNTSEIKFGKYDYPSFFNKSEHVYTEESIISKINDLYDNENFDRTKKILTLLEREIGVKEKDINNYFFLNTELLAQFISINKENTYKLTNELIPKYLSTQRKNYAEIKTFLFRDKRPFDEVYYPTTIKLRNELIKLKSVEELFLNDKNIIISGVAGSGKSTLINHLFLSTLKTHQGIPITIELRKLNSFSESIYDYIRKEIFYNEFSSTDKTLHEFLRLGKIIFMFDGFDEIKSDLKQNIINQIETFVDAYSDNRFIITTRPGTYIESIKRFENANVVPLQNHEIIEFINKQKYDNEEFIERLIGTINHPKNHNYIHYLSNPLLLSMFMLNFENYPELPQRKSRFYENVFNTLYQRHDGTSKHGFQSEKITNLKQDDFEFILKRFCFLSYFEGVFSFDERYLKDKFTLIKAKKVEMLFDNNKLIEDLHVAISIFVKEGLEYKFHHRSMQEYFVAMFIKDLPLDTKKIIYSQKFSGDHDIFDNEFNLWQLCLEIDKIIFSENFIIPRAENFLEKIDFEDDKKIIYSFLNIFPLSFKFTYTVVEKEIIVREGISIGGLFHFNHSLLEFIGLEIFLITTSLTKYIRTKNSPLVEYCIKRKLFTNVVEKDNTSAHINIGRLPINIDKEDKKRIAINLKDEVINEEFLAILINSGFSKDLRFYFEKIKKYIEKIKSEIKAERENDFNLVDLI